MSVSINFLKIQYVRMRLKEYLQLFIQGTPLFARYKFYFYFLDFWNKVWCNGKAWDSSTLWHSFLRASLTVSLSSMWTLLAILAQSAEREICMRTYRLKEFKDLARTTKVQYAALLHSSTSKSGEQVSNTDTARLAMEVKCVARARRSLLMPFPLSSSVCLWAFQCFRWPCSWHLEVWFLPFLPATEHSRTASS